MRVLINVTTGSRGYGTNIPTSDYDTRGVFCSENLGTLFGFDGKVPSIKSTTNDGILWELVHFFKQLKSGSLNAVELLFCERDDILQLDNQFDNLVLQNKFKFLDIPQIISKTFGHAGESFRKSIGESFKLTSDQKHNIHTYGYCPKSAVSCLRMYRCGIWLLEDNIYHVKVVNKSLEFHKTLMDIRISPEKYNINQIQELMFVEQSKFEHAVNSRNVQCDLKFDNECAINVIKQIYINE